MILTREQSLELMEAAKPLIKWINENCHPHVTVVVDATSADLMESIAVVQTEEFLRD